MRHYFSYRPAIPISSHIPDRRICIRETCIHQGRAAHRERLQKLQGEGNRLFGETGIKAWRNDARPVIPLSVRFDLSGGVQKLTTSSLGIPQHDVKTIIVARVSINLIHTLIGRTDEDEGERLYVSPQTVTHHLRDSR